MSVRILGGLAKGLELGIARNAQGTLRPTAVQLRRAIFDANQDMGQKIFLDFFAGTGAMGLEALSRGAKTAVFFEQEKSFVKMLKQNIQKLAERLGDEFCLENQAKVFPVSCLDYQRYQSYWQVQSNIGQNMVVFIDPPYEQIFLYRQLFELLKKDREFFAHAELWIESDKHKGILPDEIERLLGKEKKRSYTHGDHFILTFS